MPIRIKISTKEPKFKGDLPTHNVTVSGPDELFSTGMERFLFLHGLNALNSEGDFNVWSTRYSISPPAYYLAKILEEKYGVEIEPSLRKKLKFAVDEFSDEDGLDQFIGSTDPLAGGNKPLSVSAGKLDFIANCNQTNWERRTLLEGAGWMPLENPNRAVVERFGDRPYKTRDPFLAANLEPFMAESVKDHMRKALGLANVNIARSKSQDAPEGFDLAAPGELDYLPFQKGGINQVLKSGRSAIIADDMGLGKTIQGIGIINGRPDAKRVLIICQANMRLKWVQEVEKWKIDPDLTAGHAEGSNWPDTDVVVINYDIAQRHAAKIRAEGWDIVLADEAHNMKNDEAQRTQAILGTLLGSPGDADYEPMLPMNKGGQIVHLTGTPKPNRISELWPLLTSSRPDLWGKGPEARRAFLNRYEPPTLIKKNMKRRGRDVEIIIPLAGKPIRELELQMRLRGSGSFIRRMKRDTDLPPKFRTPIPLPYKLTKQENEDLKRVEADFSEVIDRAQAAFAKDVTPRKGSEAREIIDVINGTATTGIDFSEMARVRKNLGVLKSTLAAKFIIDELKADKELPVADRRKTVVFAHHKEVIAAIAEMAEKEFPGGVIIYDGSVTSAKKRQERVDKFQNDKKARLFIMSLSGATGITLTAAARMRIVEPDWSPANMSQIEDRIWRIGQEQSVDIGYLFIPNSMDINVGQSLINKMETDERAINTLSFRGMKGGKKKVGAFANMKPEKIEKPELEPETDDGQMQMSL